MEKDSVMFVMLEKNLESPLDSKEIKPVHPKGDQFWIFIGRTDAEPVTPILWPPDTKNWVIVEDSDAGRDWRQEEKGTTKDEMVGWHPSPTRSTWVWASSGSWWWRGRPAVLQSMRSQRVGHDWGIELNWTSVSLILKWQVSPKPTFSSLEMTTLKSFSYFFCNYLCISK